jgi:hypothetical protein
MIVARLAITATLAGAIALTPAFTRAMHASSRAVAGAPQCAGPEYHQFDFFEGDWDAYDVAAPDSVVARNTVTPMLGGCAVREVYVQNDGVRGESFSAFDATRHGWHQSWITNRGSMLLLDGKLDGGRMVLVATDYDERGDSSLVRGIWIPQRGSVRETAQRSRDGGKTWEPLFDIVFRPHNAAAGR